MKFHLNTFSSLLATILFLVITSSCSKDSDLLAAYVIENKETPSELASNVVDDFFTVNASLGSEIILDVLENDNFENIDNVQIVAVSDPTSGTITINEDNTLSYVPFSEGAENEEAENVDSFTYTTEETTENNESITDKGDVTINHNNNLQMGSFWSQSQMDEVKLRLINGWNNSKFPDEAKLIEDAKNYFINNPESTRYTNIDKSTPIGSYSIEYDASTSISFEPLVNNNPYIDYPFKAAIWGRAFEDKDIANKLLSELLWYTSNPDYDYSNTSKFLRNRRADINPFFLMMAWNGKWQEIYNEYIKHYSDINQSQITEIESWFESIADWAYHTANYIISQYLGQNWIYSDSKRSTGLANSSSPIIEDENGNPYLQYKISDFSSALNNRLWDSIEFIHSYGLHSGNELYRDMGVSFFKYTLKYHVYPNGLIGEMKRITKNDASLGLAYCHVILTGLIRVAHAEETAQQNGLISKHGWNIENLYNYETTEGHISGEIYDGYVYNGGSTTNGNTKSLKLALTTTSKFYRSSENGGFEKKFYYDGKVISGENRKYPAIFAMANSFYNDQFLYEHSVMDTSAGLPSGPINSQGGFGKGVMSWGKGLSPILWIDMENKIFK